MKFFQKLGKALMLPVAALPVASIFMGVCYWIDPTGWGANSMVAAILLKAGGALIDNMAILFAIGVGIGMSDDGDGSAGLAGLVSWLVITTVLSTGAVAMYTGADANPAFAKITSQFTGILSGIIGATCYNKFKNTKLPDALGFFSGKRCVAIVTSMVSLVACLVLFIVWPAVYGALVAFGQAILSTGAIGAGIYAFLNRLLIPVGLHHALNSVFWFDVAGVNDLANFWAGTGTTGVTGQYMAGFFPVMMFGLPAAALAMYHTAKPEKKKAAGALLLAAALSSFFTGVTEPLEFAFMFLAPAAYLVHALLTGVSATIVAALPTRAGFNFSAGLVDYVLSFKAPHALNVLWLIGIGLVFAVIYYVVFRFIIVKFDLKTPGREDDDIEAEKAAVLANNDFTQVAAIILEGLGGKENIASLDNCITRVRAEVKDQTKVDEKKIKSAGISGVMRPGKTSVQVIVGTKVQFVVDEMKKMI